MKVVLVIGILMLMVVPLAAARDLSLRRLSIVQEEVLPYEGVLVSFKLGNFLRDDIDDVTVTLSLPEIGVSRTFGPDDVEWDESFNRLYYMGLPEDLPPGEHVLRVTVQNEDYRIVKHRYFTVMPLGYCMDC